MTQIVMYDELKYSIAETPLTSTVVLGIEGSKSLAFDFNKADNHTKMDLLQFVALFLAKTKGISLRP
jgi:hypothetical protein